MSKYKAGNLSPIFYICLFVLALVLSCAPTDTVSVHKAVSPVATPISPSAGRPSEYRSVPLPDVIWSREIEHGSEFTPVVANDALYILGHIRMYSMEPSTGKLRWQRELPAVPSALPLVSDGVIYVSAEHWDEQTPKTGMVIALDAPNGALIWKYDIPRESWGELWADPVLADGMVYVGSFNGNMYALDAATGTLRWSYATGDVIRWPASVAYRAVYFGSVDHNLYALDASTGILRWSYETDRPLWIGPVVAGGLAYQAPGDRHLYALDAATGKLRWRYTTEADRWSRPVVAEGILYASASTDFSDDYQQGSDIERLRHYGYVTALDAHTGRLLWKYRTDGDPSTPVVAAGMVYVSAGDERSYLLGDPPESGNPSMRGHVYALDAATGNLIWQRRAVSEISPGPAGLTVAEGAVYVESSNQFRYNSPSSPPEPPIHGQVTAFDALTGETRWLFETDDQFANPPTVANGVAYLVSLNGQVHAVRAASSR